MKHFRNSVNARSAFDPERIAAAGLAPLLLTSLLGTSSPAQERTPSPLPPSVDIQTPAEPTRGSAAPFVRPSIGPSIGLGAAPGDRVGTADPKAPRITRSAIDRSVVHYATTREGTLWARGASYKASFDASGAVYYPAFGRAQPHNLPHALSPDLVSVGGESIAFEHTAAPVRAGDRVEMDRGAFVEAYNLAPQSVEQTFVFSSLPRTGDLDLHIPVSSELDACTSVDGGLEFHGAAGRVIYGRATAIDAAGRRVSAATKLVNGAIAITVDAKFLSDAELPLVIDPVVSTFPIDVSANDNYWADSAYDAWGHMWFVVYEEWFSASDRDCAYEVLDDNGAAGSRVYLDLSTDSWDSVHCANNAQAQQFLVVASVTPSPAHGGPVYVLGTTIYTNGWIGSQSVITAQEPYTIRNCVVGGDPYIGGPSFYCVAYEIEDVSTHWFIHARLVRPDGTLVGSGPITVSGGGGTTDVGPAISKSNGTHDWMIVWQADNFSFSDVKGRIVRWDGLPGTLIPISVGHVTPQWQVAVSSPLSGTSRYLATWQQTLASGDNDIIMALLDGGGTVLDRQDLNQMEGQNYLNDQQDSSVDSDGEHFLVSYAEAWGSYDIYASDVYVSGNNTLGLAEAHIPVDVDWTTDLSPRVTSCFSGGATDPARKHRYLVAWNATPQGGGPADVAGAFFDTIPGGSVTPFCFGDGSSGNCPCVNNGAPGHGCANSVDPAGALLSGTGVPSPVVDTLVLQASGMPATALCVFLQGSLIGNTYHYGDGLRCVGGTLLRIGTKQASGGIASYPGPGDPPVSSRGGVPMSGAQRPYQVWYRNPDPNFCTPETFNVSNGVLVDWAI
jgi:hypothetical protein